MERVAAYVTGKSMVETSAGITAKAIRIEEKARLLLGRMEEIASRALPPSPQVSGQEIKPPQSSHAVFALEATEQTLERAINIADSVIGGM